MSHIFISYSRRNKDCVYRVVNQMKRLDFPIWIDSTSIELTSDWLETIESAIAEASVFMLFWSREAADSSFVKEEIRLARE